LAPKLGAKNNCQISKEQRLSSDSGAKSQKSQRMDFVFFPPKDKWRLPLSERSLFSFFWCELGWISVPVNRGYPDRESTNVSKTKHKGSHIKGRPRVKNWPLKVQRAVTLTESQPMFLELNIKALISREDPGSRPDPSRYFPTYFSLPSSMRSESFLVRFFIPFLYVKLLFPIVKAIQYWFFSWLGRWLLGFYNSHQNSAQLSLSSSNHRTTLIIRAPRGSFATRKFSNFS